MIAQGPLTWGSFAPYERAPRIAGRDLSGRFGDVRITPVDAGIGLEMLDRGSVFQVEPARAGASLSRAPEEITISFSAVTEEDARLAGLIAASCRNSVQELILWDVFSDYWPITATLRTAWAMSRRSAPTPPDVHSGRILATDGSSVTNLTLVLGTPAAGEIAVAGTTATTDDLTASAGGLLEVRYYPIRMVQGVGFTSEAAEAGSLRFEMTFREWLV